MSIRAEREPFASPAGSSSNARCELRKASRLNEPDAALIARTQQGDQQAFAELVRRYQAVSFRVAYIVTGSAEEAEDVAQEGFVRAYRSIDRFRLELPFRPWLLRIVANAARTHRVRAARHLALSLSQPSPPHGETDGSASPENFAIAAEAASELMTAFQTLRRQDQQVIALRYFVELSEAEMAAALGCARGTVKSRLSRALGRLRSVVAAGAGEVPDA